MTRLIIFMANGKDIEVKGMDAVNVLNAIKESNGSGVLVLNYGQQKIHIFISQICYVVEE